jgi:hypothetical protein
MQVPPVPTLPFVRSARLVPETSRDRETMHLFGRGRAPEWTEALRLPINDLD